MKPLGGGAVLFFFFLIRKRLGRTILVASYCTAVMKLSRLFHPDERSSCFCIDEAGMLYCRINVVPYIIVASTLPAC